MVNPGYRVIMDGAPVEIGDTLEEVIRRRSDSGEYGPGDAEAVFNQQMSIDPDRPQVRRRLRPNGTTIDVRTTPLPEGGHLSVVTDVTSLITAESELARRAKSMDAMLANIRHGIVLWDREQRIIACNAVAEQLLLAPPGLLVPGRTLGEVIKSAQDRGNLGMGQVGIDTAVRLGTQDRSKSHQDQRLTRTGRVLEVRTDPTPDGGFVTTYTDVTNIRQAEEALQQARRAAESANTAKSRFLAAMSHELRAPLNTIIAASELIKRAADGPRSTHIAEAADDAHAAGRHLSSMIDTILDVARLEAGRFDLAEDRVDLFDLVRACVKQSDASAAAAEVSLKTDLPGGLPGVRGDMRRLRQALHHLVTNAVKFTGAGGQVWISTQQDTDDADLLLKVSDTGIGIAEADLDRVFEPFANADAGPNRRFPGTGLGLYVSRALMRAQGGELLLRSRPGEGTTAIIRIPAERLLPAGFGSPADFDFEDIL
jgi:signal transduction histidine kinase